MCESGVVSAHLSDHELVYCVRKLNWERAPSQVKTFRNYAHFNVHAFCKDLKGVNWNSAPSPDGPVIVDKLWHDLKREFIAIAECHAPLTQRHVRGIDNCPWLNTRTKIYSLTWRESGLILTIKSFLRRKLNETKRDTRFVSLQQ